MAALFALLTPVAGLYAAEERISGPASHETVTIEASEAWEDESPDIIHFKGNFSLKTSEWSVLAEQATLYGKLDDPETIQLTGAPASIVIHSETVGDRRVISGEASRIVFQKESNSIYLQGDATIVSDDNTLSGNQIEYQIDSDRITAGGEEGIRILIETAEPL